MPLPVFPKTKKWKSCNNVETSRDIPVQIEEEVEETKDTPNPHSTSKKTKPSSSKKKDNKTPKATKKTDEKIGKQSTIGVKRAKPLPAGGAAKQPSIKSGHNNLQKGGVSKTSRNYYHQRACSTTTGKAAATNGRAGGIKSSIYNHTDGGSMDLITRKLKNGDVGKLKETRV